MSGAMLGITDKMEAWSLAPSPHPAGTDPGIKELGLVILTWAELTGENVKVLEEKHEKAQSLLQLHPENNL